MIKNYDTPQPIQRSLAQPGRDWNPLDEYYRRDHPVNIIFSTSGDVNLGELQQTSFDFLITSIASARRIDVAQIPANTVVSIVNEIATQAENDVKQASSSKDADARIRITQDAICNLLKNYRQTPDASCPPQALRRIKDLYLADPLLQPSAGAWEMQYIEQSNVAKLIVLDERNGEMDKERLGIKEEVAGEILTELKAMGEEFTIHPRGYTIYPENTERRALAYTIACGQAATKEVMYQFLDGVEVIPMGFLPVFGNALGFGTMRSYINEYIKSHPDQRTKLEDLSKRVGLDKGEKVFFDLGEVYQAADEDKTFENYQPYSQLQEADMAVLDSYLPKDGAIVDLGCGTGRHLIPLLKQGYHVEGVEIDESAFPSILTKQPGAVLKVGSMHNLPYEDHSVNAVYLLGRTLAHLTSTYEAVAVFRELRRVLKDKGVVIFDLPDLRTEEMREYSNERLSFLSDKLHIWNREFGTIHDSPNGKHYFDRFVLSYVYQVALIGGFNAEVVKEAVYQGASGKEAKNEYWLATLHPQGPIDTRIEELQPLKHLTSSGDKGLELDRY